MLIIFDFIKKYLILTIMVFLVSINFDRDNTNKAVFLNLHPKNIFVELEKDLNLFLNNKIKINKLEKYGYFLIPYIFENAKNDSSHKNEYLSVYKELGINFLEIPENKLYNIDFFIKNYDDNKNKIKNTNLNKIIKECYRNDTNCKKLNFYKELLIPNLLDFIKQNINKNNKNINYLINSLAENMKIKTPKDNIKEWFNFLYLKKRNYYNKINSINKVKLVITETKLYEKLLSSLTMNFGIYNNKSLFKESKTFFIRTIFIFLLSIILAYYINLVLISKQIFLFKKYSKIFNFNKNIPAIIIIFLLANIISTLNSSYYKLIFFLLSFIFTVVIILNNEINILYKNIINNDNIIKMKLYGLNKNIILKHYVFKKIKINYLEKIIKLTPVFAIYLLILEYLTKFDALGLKVINSLKEQNYKIIFISLLFWGLTIIITQSILKILINFNKRK